MSRTGGIAPGVMLTVLPGSIELSAGDGAHLVDRAGDTGANLTLERNTPRRLLVCAGHGHSVRGYGGYEFVWNSSAGRGGLTPEERDTEVRTAGTAGGARVTRGHECALCQPDEKTARF